jgi:hypothetical protein
MSSGSTSSTSSTPTPGSWDDVAKLGEYILDQLGRDHRSDNLLVHWVAHRLAEHMRTAETSDDPRERDAARDAAALLIAQLWQARGGWPQGWPPDAVRKFVEGVRPAAGQSYGEGVPQLPPWLSTLVELELLHREELTAWLNGALLEVGADELKRALDTAPDDAPEPAADLLDIQWQLRRHESAEEWIAVHAQEGEDPSRRADRARILERVLKGITERRAALIQRTVKDARRGQRRKPSIQGTRVVSTRRRGSGRRTGEAKR